MELTGKIIQVLEPRSGVSKNSGNSWKTQEYVIETQEQYPHRMMFSIWGEDKIQQAAINAGDEVTVSFDINCREYNGRWYNDIRAWKVEHVQNGRQQSGETPAGSGPVASPFAPSDEKDDLPF